VIVLEDVHFFLIVLYKSHIPKASEGNVFTFFLYKKCNTFNQGFFNPILLYKKCGEFLEHDF